MPKSPMLDDRELLRIHEYACGLTESSWYHFEHYDVMIFFAFKGSINTFFPPTKRNQEGDLSLEK